MSLNYIIPNEEIDKLICISCSNYLSVFPIYISTDTASAICGRCTPFNRDCVIRDDAYETIAEHMLFPCRFTKNGCEEELTPHRMKDHETTCTFGKFECPCKIDTNCSWLGDCSDLGKHFQEDHVNLLLKTAEFEWKFDVTREENLLLSVEEEYFIIKRKTDAMKEVLCFSVQPLEQTKSKNYSYALKIVTNDRKKSYDLPNNIKERISLTRDFIKEKLQHAASVFVQIKIIKDGLEGKPVNTEKQPNLNWGVLKELECPVCYDLMYPPIYQCANSHSICKECRGIKQCPWCKEYTADTRNYSLEKVTEFLTYPCKFYKSGCSYTSNWVNIKEHEDTCEFYLYECPLNKLKGCSAKMTKSQSVDHVVQKHKSFILKSNSITSPFDISKPRDSFYLIISFGMVFVVRYKYNNQKFYWSVQSVGSYKDSKKFKFDIDISDNSKSNLRCYMKGFCISIGDKIDFEDTTKCVMLTYEQLEPMLAATLDYNINIILEQGQNK